MTSGVASWRLYGWVHLAWMGVCVVVTRLLFRPCRLVRLPILLRGRRNIVFGPGFVCGYLVRLDAFAGPRCLVFGRNVQLNDFVHIGVRQQITIGDNALIASRVFISDHDHGRYSGATDPSPPEQSPADRIEPTRPVHIGHNVWIGEGACILSGVTIGDGAIVGAGAVVTRDVPPACIAVGVPARVVRRYNPATRTWQAEPP